MASKTPTMREVAQLAGVSVQTVSCVVNNKDTISPETRKRVLQAIKQLNYRRSPIARSMRTGQTCLIGLLVLDITNPVLSTIASAVEAAAYQHDYQVILYNVSMDAERERASLEAAAEGLLDGLIIVNTVDRDRTLTFLADEDISVVLIDSLENPVVPCVSVDNFQAAYLATQHAITLGHRRIAHLAGSASLMVARRRQAGYLQALADCGLDYRRIIVSKTARWDYQSGYETMQELLAEGPLPSAVFAASDTMAIGAYRAIAEAGLHVPDDLSVIGFDDIEASAFAAPPLTTIRQPFTQIAERAFDLLLQLLGDDDPPANTQVFLPPELVVRQSTRSLS